MQTTYFSRNKTVSTFILVTIIDKKIVTTKTSFLALKIKYIC